MNWKYTDGTRRVAARVLPDGAVESCLAEVLPPGTPVDAPDPDPPAVDYSDPDNHVKAIKALALVVMAWNNKTLPQLKAAFKQAWDILP